MGQNYPTQGAGVSIPDFHQSLLEGCSLGINLWALGLSLHAGYVPSAESSQIKALRQKAAGSSYLQYTVFGAGGLTVMGGAPAMSAPLFQPKCSVTFHH